ncbi:hypothetical protein KC19_3G019100 [Ceratodon purpureus]|uniref:Uncharacterized protein n=1 Tax=Ceratodon purpureus TaxID=3225 RepID=A0A8T0IH93_CERPU|nr:hypothetical protein KC19_3G019100 [Ceratodon purpureus]
MKWKKGWRQLVERVMKAVGVVEARSCRRGPPTRFGGRTSWLWEWIIWIISLQSQ